MWNMVFRSCAYIHGMIDPGESKTTSLSMISKHISSPNTGHWASEKIKNDRADGELTEAMNQLAQVSKRSHSWRVTCIDVISRRKVHYRGTLMGVYSLLMLEIDYLRLPGSCNRLQVSCFLVWSLGHHVGHWDKINLWSELFFDKI